MLVVCVVCGVFCVMCVVDVDVFEVMFVEVVMCLFDVYCVENVIFLSECLCVVCDSDVNVLLYVWCLYVVGKVCVVCVVFGMCLMS